MKHLSRTALTLLLGAFVVLGLSACAEGTGDGPDADTTDTAAMTTPPADTGMGGMQDGGMMGDSATAQSTIRLLRQGVREIAVNQAVRNINGWQSQLEGMSQLSDLNDNLGQLKSELQASGQPDGQAIGDLMTQMGEQTTSAAENASGQQMTQLRSLGQLLTQIGNRLTGGGGNGGGGM